MWRVAWTKRPTAFLGPRRGGLLHEDAEEQQCLVVLLQAVPFDFITHDQLPELRNCGYVLSNGAVFIWPLSAIGNVWLTNSQTPQCCLSSGHANWFAEELAVPTLHGIVSTLPVRPLARYLKGAICDHYWTRHLRCETVE